MPRWRIHPHLEGSCFQVLSVPRDLKGLGGTAGHKTVGRQEEAQESRAGLGVIRLGMEISKHPWLEPTSWAR